MPFLDEVSDSLQLNDDIALSSAQVHQMINKLSLICFVDLSHQQVADILEVPIGTECSRLHQARNCLRS